MSRQLSKILVSCALVVTLLLAVVGTVFASYYSFGTVLNVEIYLNKMVNAEDTNASAAPFAQVRYDGKEVNKSLSVSHTTKVDLDVLSKGYNFVGWYKGTKADYEAKRSAGTLKDSDYLQAGENNRLSFTASDYSNLVAVFDIVEYDVTWNYYTTGADWDAQDTNKLSTEIPNLAKEHYLYGQRLSADLDASEDDYVFCGWQIAGDETKQDYKYATFVVSEKTEENVEEQPADTGVSSVNAIELNAHWRMANPYSILYYNGSSLLTTDEVYETKDNYTLKTPEVLDTTLESLTLKDGYRYYWSTDIAGVNQITGFETLEGDVSVYLQEKVITYTAKVENDSLGFANYNNNSTFTFTIEDYSKLTEVLVDNNWTKAYSYHMVSGVTYNGGGTFSAASDVIQKVFETNRHSAPESEIVLAPVVSGYKNIVVENLKLISYSEINNGIPEGKQSAVYGGNGNEFSLSGGAVKTLATNEGTVKLLNIFELLGLKDVSSEEVVTLYNKSDEATREIITLRAIKITIEGKEESEGIVINGNTSACDLIETLIDSGIITADRSQSTLTIKNIKVMFCAESIQG